MITKTEQNLTANMPASRAPLSIKSIIKDLQDLEKSLLMNNELEALKTKMKKLEDENSRMKTEMEAMEADRKLYYNQFHQNVKELNELKVENESLKAEISSLKKTEDPNIGENVCSTFQSPISVNENISDSEKDYIETTPTLPTEDISVEIEPSELEQLNGRGHKRPRPGQEQDISDVKKAKIELVQTFGVWKCIHKPCNARNLRFDTIEELRSHTAEIHPERKFMCDKCSFSSPRLKKLKEHEQKHKRTFDSKFKVEGAKICTHCDIIYPGNYLLIHNNAYH